MGIASATAYEFVKDARGNVTHLMVHDFSGDQKAYRKQR
jgi:hypothetical protein